MDRFVPASFEGRKLRRDIITEHGLTLLSAHTKLTREHLKKLDQLSITLSEERLEQEFRFTVLDHRLDFQGICHRCNALNDEKNNV